MSAALVFAPLNYVGWGAMDQLLPAVSKFQATKILLVADPVLHELSITDQVANPLRDSGYEVELYTDIVPEPPLESAEKLIAYAKNSKSELVIGLGGGSALDLAKLAAVLSVQGGSAADYLNLTGTRKIQEKGLPKILIPTTAGTGSEVTNISVLSLGGTKDVITHDFLLADIVIADPKLTLSVPSKVTAATGMDALTHAVESYVSLNSSPETEALSLHAIRLISRSLRRAVQNCNDKQARTDMCHGSYIAGLAFFNAGVAGVHALAYPLGGQFHLSHGESNAVLLPYVMGYIRKACKKKMADILNAMGCHSAFLSEEEASLRCVEELRRIVCDVGIPDTLREYGILPENIAKLSEEGEKQKRLLARSPLPLKKEDIMAIYQSALTGCFSEPFHD
jgi:alcohol dehydrogenase